MLNLLNRYLFTSDSVVWRPLGLSVRVAEHLVVVISAAAATVLVVHVLHDGVLVVMMLHIYRHVDDDLLVTATVPARLDQRRQDGYARYCQLENMIRRTSEPHYKLPFVLDLTSHISRHVSCLLVSKTMNITAVLLNACYHHKSDLFV